MKMVNESVIGALRRHLGLVNTPPPPTVAATMANNTNEMPPATCHINSMEQAPTPHVVSNGNGGIHHPLSSGCNGLQSADSSKDVTPIMSALPSSANLLNLKDTRKSGHVPPVGPRRIQRQISECLPPSAMAIVDPSQRSPACVRSYLVGLSKIPALLLLLFLFICSLDFLSTAFRLIAGKAAGK